MLPGKSPVIGGVFGLFEVTVDGELWEEVESIVLSNSTINNNKTYEKIIDKDYAVVVKFGNNVNGKVPPKSSTIDIRYRVGGGEDGVVIRHKLDKTFSVGKNGTTYTIRVENPYITSGASDGESLDRAKEFAPSFFATQHREVTGEDYTSFANRNPNVNTKAISALIQNTAAANIVRIYALKFDATISPPDLIDLTPDEKEDLKAFIDGSKMETDTIEIADGKKKAIDVDLTIYSRSNGNVVEIQESVETVITDFFDFRNNDYGQSFKLSLLLSAIQNSSNDILYVAFDEASLGPNFDSVKKIIPVDTSEVMATGVVTITVLVDDTE